MVMKNKNPLVHSLRQRIREWVCNKKGHAFYVISGHYPGMPQAHCFRCGIKDKQCSPKLEKWIVPLSIGLFEKNSDNQK